MGNKMGKKELDYGNEVRRIVADYLKIDGSKLKPESTFVQDLGVDSFGMFELTHEIQTKFNVQISDEELKNINNIGDVVSYIKSKKGD